MKRFSRTYYILRAGLLAGIAFLAPIHSIAQKEEKTKAEAKTETAADQKRICKMDVFYNWTPEKSLKIEITPDERKRYFGTIMDEGFDEEEVRQRLLGRVSAVSTEAMEVCTKMHQEKSVCLVDRLREISKRFARYDYQRRKLLTEAAERDCFVGGGECVSVVVGEVECWGNASPDSPSLADFVPVTFTTPIAEDEEGEVVVEGQQVAPAKKGDVVEVKRKKVLKATAPMVKPAASKNEPEPTPADKGYNAPFVVE